MEIVNDGGIRGGSDSAAEENAAPVMKTLPVKPQGRPSPSRH